RNFPQPDKPVCTSFRLVQKKRNFPQPDKLVCTTFRLVLQQTPFTDQQKNKTIHKLRRILYLY
ncbi:MAG: hypothetical protein RBS16_07455, partial [Candidatus Cloacimonadales bacterium]|nr:hypothetical protein [Candidatus Cloacimonadales bacterium]